VFVNTLIVGLNWKTWALAQVHIMVNRAMNLPSPESHPRSRRARFQRAKDGLLAP